MTYVTAQTRVNVVSDLKAAARIDALRDPFDEDQGGRYSDPLETSFHRDQLVDYRAMFKPDIEQDAAEHRRLAVVSREVGDGRRVARE